MLTLPQRTQAAYQDAFATEAAHNYPVVDAFEDERGYRLDSARLLSAARVLACPLKRNPPNWQHGRVLYSAVREYLKGYQGRALLLDVGTAKGFSALCLRWALHDAGVTGTVVSVDVIDPRGRVFRNSVAELDNAKTLTELLQPWPEADDIRFLQSTGVNWLRSYAGRIECAFVDGKHTGAVVFEEGTLLADRQQPGDLVVFDDVHLSDVRDAVLSLRAYETAVLSVLPTRAYAIARRRAC